MRPISFFLAGIALFLFAACHQRPQNTSSGKFPGISDSLAARVMGTYSGNFNKGLITLVINYISGRTVSGYDVHKGLRRNVNGEVVQQGNLLNFVLKEPGDNPYDGVFTFSLDTDSLKINGKWVPLDSTKVPSRQLALRINVGYYSEDPNTWTSENGGDSTLTFYENGTCDLTFYQRQEDSASSSNAQIITIRGNFERKMDTFRIEWQKNNYLPASLMKLVKTHGIPGNDSVPGTQPILQGNGLKFTISNAG
jgi:hypothetical protein